MPAHQPTKPAKIWTASALEGPFVDHAAICARVSKAEPPEPALQCEAAKPLASLGPFRHAAWLLTADHPGAGFGTRVYHLLLSTEKGAFVLPAVETETNPGAFGVFEQVHVGPLHLRTAPGVGESGGQTVIWIEGQSDRSNADRGRDEVESWHRRWTLICGVGPSGIPSCLPRIFTVIEGTRERLNEATDAELRGVKHDLWRRRQAIQIERLPSGGLRIKRLTKPQSGFDGPAVGTYTLRFP